MGTILNQVELDASLRTRTPSPIMNRGYFARVKCIQALIRSFIECHSEFSDLQMVNMGCGFDTQSLQLMSSTEGVKFSKIFEVDYTDIVEQKAAYLSKSDKISVSKLADVDCGYEVKLTKTSLRLIGSDLCDAAAVLSNLGDSGLDSRLPTLVLTECVMVYIEREACKKLLLAISSYLQLDATWITYDMVNVGDPFGRNMLKNLQEAGYCVPGFEQNPSKSHHKELFASSGVARFCSVYDYA